MLPSTFLASSVQSMERVPNMQFGGRANLGAAATSCRHAPCSSSRWPTSRRLHTTLAPLKEVVNHPRSRLASASSEDGANIAATMGQQHPSCQASVSKALDISAAPASGNTSSDNGSSTEGNPDNASHNYSRRAVTLSFTSALAAPPFLLLQSSSSTALAAEPNSDPQPFNTITASSSGNNNSNNSAGSGSRFKAKSTSPAGQERLLNNHHKGGSLSPASGDLPPPSSSTSSSKSNNSSSSRRVIWPPVPQVQLAPGLRVSKVVRGCWQLSGRHHGDAATDRTSGSDVSADLAAFHRAGVTTLDTADSYGPSETLIGQYLRLNPAHAPPQAVLATKLSYVGAEEMAGVNRTLVEYAVRGSLARLGVRQLDLVQLQWADPRVHRRWRDVLGWLADLREAGLIRHIGLSNFNVPDMTWAAESGVGVVSNQVQLSLIDRRPQLYMQQAAASYGIKLLAYGTLAGGLLADKYYNVPANRVRLDTASKQKYGLVLREAAGGGRGGGGGGGSSSGWSWFQEVLEACRQVAGRHPGTSASSVAIAWVLHQPQVSAAIVGARNARHIRDLQAACALKLDDTDLLDLDAVWEGVPNPPTSDVYAWERGGMW
ncbi:hypothetical protein Agub_g10653 [Astrephomene gubernaculifera]|uniref:NADP-dependent oxidoreductase domain-containing protein n=1 Tax=Astrephomene gubernaculifera TaxID=47775 RepID=A0AAD3HQ45_9CHLO|nr:hypothetical protein Agub_g10653 [Astrephomene gubernaculifera]